MEIYENHIIGMSCPVTQNYVEVSLAYLLKRQPKTSLQIEVFGRYAVVLNPVLSSS
jgi:hypothetical protein